MILDTVALDSLLAGDRHLIRLLKPHSPLSLPAIALAEYRFGLLSSTQRQKLESALDGLEGVSVILSLDSATARHYAVIRHELALAGTPIPWHDIWIAALARQYNLPVVTQDAHFARVKGLKRISW